MAIINENSLSTFNSIINLQCSAQSDVLIDFSGLVICECVPNEKIIPSHMQYTSHSELMDFN